MPTPEGNMTSWEHGILVRSANATPETHALASALVGTAATCAEDVAQQHEIEGWDEDALYALVDLCGRCGWWHRCIDLQEDDDSENGLSCRECREEPCT